MRGRAAVEAGRRNVRGRSGHEERGLVI
jgi:hypothetical protein